MQSTSKATVSAPIAHVWEVLADHEGMTNWAPGLKATLATAGKTDRNGVGAVRRIAAPGPAPTIVEEIVAFEPGRRLVYKALAGVPLKNYQGEVVLSEVPGGTAISYTISADQRVPLLEKAATATIAKTLLTLFVRQVKATA